MGGKYSYHGACDLVLIDAPSFGGDKGLTVHIRTKHRRSFSYITNAAVLIGDEIFEVTNKKDEAYYLNGVLDVPMPATIGGHKIFHKHDNDRMHTFHIELDGRENLMLRILKDFVTVTIHHGMEKDFGDSLGLMGSFHTGTLYARDGRTVIDDVNAFGEEWQVRDDELKLFQTMEMPQYPEKCMPPPLANRRRRLGEMMTEEEAEKVCAKVSLNYRTFCIFDVMATNDRDMAKQY
jgi:hypothetical protein